MLTRLRGTKGESSLMRGCRVFRLAPISSGSQDCARVGHDASEPLGSSVEGHELGARPVVDFDFLDGGLDRAISERDSGSFHDRFTSCWRSLFVGADGVLPSMRHELHQPHGVDPPPPADQLQAVARALVTKAVAHDVSAIKEILDRILPFPFPVFCVISVAFSPFRVRAPSRLIVHAHFSP
jgi:hypothetical protein